MEENEISGGDVAENTSDESVEASSEPQSSTSPAQEATKTTDVPFHEHPRFKELVEQKNSFAAEAKSLQEKYAQMERQLQELSKPKNTTPDKRAAMLERLKGIDPEFADFVAELAPTKSLEEVRAELQAERQEKFRSAAVSEVNALHSTNKVDAALQAKYNLELEHAYATGQIRSLDDVKTLYKQIHEGYSKLMEDIRRKDRESYVKDKKTDTRTPSSQPKGKAAQPNTKFEFSKNKEEARAQIVARYLAESKASQDI